MEEEQIKNLNNCITHHREFFDEKSKLEISDIKNRRDNVIVAYLKDKYCPIKKCEHDETYTKVVFLPNSMEMYQECSKCNNYYPQKLIQIDHIFVDIFNVKNNTMNGDYIIACPSSDIINMRKNDVIIIESDKDAADIILKKIGNKIIKSNKRFFIKKTENSYVEDTSNIKNINNIIRKYLLGEIFNTNFCKLLKNNRIKPYSKNTSGAMNIMKMILIIIEDDKDFVKKLQLEHRININEKLYSIFPTPQFQMD